MFCAVLCVIWHNKQACITLIIMADRSDDGRRKSDRSRGEERPSRAAISASFYSKKKTITPRWLPKEDDALDVLSDDSDLDPDYLDPGVLSSDSGDSDNDDGNIISKEKKGKERKIGEHDATSLVEAVSVVGVREGAVGSGGGGDDDDVVGGASRDVGGASRDVGGTSRDVGGALSDVGGELSGVGGELSGVGGELSDVGGELSDVGGELSGVGGASDDGAVAGPSTAPEKGDSKKKGRKRARHEPEWLWKKSKTLRNLGKEYTSVKTKKVVCARKIGPPCKDGCYEKIGRENIEEIFQHFWDIGDYDRQNEYLVNCITETSYKRKYTKKAVSKRPHKVNFHVTHSSVTHSLCRVAFMNIFGIKRRKMAILLEKRRSSKSGIGVLDTDKRGKTVTPANKIKGSRLETLHEFIKLLPVVSSHYTRAKAPLRQYLPYGGSIVNLYTEYSIWMQLNYSNIIPVTQSFFRSVFTTDFNIQFAPPKTDECNTCGFLDIKISEAEDEETKEEFEKQKKEHLEEAKIAQKLMNDPSNNSEGMRAIAIDLQQQQPCPKLPINKAYYTSKLFFLNFCVYDLTKNKAHMFVWDETVAKRGPNEISSCILRWLKYVQEEEQEAITTLRVFADNCAGQNKNVFNMLMFLQQVQKRTVCRVEVIFLVSGHSFMACDRSFGVLEKVYKKNSYICSIPKYIEIMKTACKKNKYRVTVMERTHFFDIKSLEKFITNRSTGLLLKAKQLIITSEEHGGFYIKYHYELEDNLDTMTFIDLRKGRKSVKGKGRGRPRELMLADAPLAFKYPQELMLKKKKILSIDSIVYLIPLPEDKQWFTDLIARQKALLSVSEEDAYDSDDGIEEDLDNPENVLLVDVTVRAADPDSPLE